jgi:hypothetical protein
MSESPPEVINIRWRAEVLEPGEYRVFCPKEHERTVEELLERECKECEPSKE